MDNDKYKKLFYSLASKCKTVLCCRVTPKQKAQMVNLIKQHQPSTTTLAIGDGANDVNMITSANIGIGIIGVEGKQAARASDYAIGQFQFLKRLLFIHGRESYRKNSFIVVYNFYKNFLFVIPQFILGFESLFGGQTIYEPFIYQLYNILFAAFPIIWFGIYDRQLSDAALMNNPKHYTQGIVGKLFGKKRFWKWILYGLIQALILYVYLFRLITMAYNTLGDTQDLKLSGSICYSAVVVIVNVKVIQTTSTHSVVSVVLVVISIMLYFIFIAGMNGVGSVYNCGNFDKMVTSLSYYLKIGCVVVMCTMIDIGMKYVCKYWQCGANAFEYYNCNRLEHSMEMPVEIEVLGNVEHEYKDVNEDNDDIELSDVDHDDDDQL
jgi:phospholipid-transporting ATPase